MRKLSSLTLFLLCAPGLYAQSTTVSGTVTDGAGQTWNNGSFQFSFVPNPAYPSGPYTWPGGSIPLNISGVLNSAGSYSVSIPTNTAISPIGTSWAVQFCPQATSPCYTISSVVISGSTFTLNATPPAIAISLINAPSAPMLAYSDSEISSALIGSYYYQLPAMNYRFCQAVSGPICTLWNSFGSGPPPTGFPRLDQVLNQNQAKTFNQGGSALGFTAGPGLNLSGETTPVSLPVIGGCTPTSNGQICFDSTGLNFIGYNGGVENFGLFPSTVNSGDVAGFLLSGGKWTLYDVAPITNPAGTTIADYTPVSIQNNDVLAFDNTGALFNFTIGLTPDQITASSYTFNGTERRELVYFTATGAKTAALPQASELTAFNSNWNVYLWNNSSSGNLTTTVSGSLFLLYNNTTSSTLTMQPGEFCILTSDASANSGNGYYFPVCSVDPAVITGSGFITGTLTSGIVPVASGPTSLINGSILDDGTHAARDNNGYDVNSLGGYLYWVTNNTSTGTTLDKMVCDDGTGKGIICPHATSTTNDPLGVAYAANGAAPGTTGSTGVCNIGFCNVVMDNTATANHYAQQSTSVDGDLSDVGASVPTNGQPYWHIIVGNSGAGTTALFRNMDSSELNASSGGGGKSTTVQINGTSTKNIANLVNGTGITFAVVNSGNTSTVTPTVTASGGLSGMTAGQVPLAATATTVTSSVPLQGTDANILTAATLGGSTGSALCKSANGGATTSGCSSGGITSINTSATGPAVTIQATGSAGVSTSGNTITISGVNGPPAPNVNALGSVNPYTVQNSDNTWRDSFSGGATAITLPQANTIAVSPFIATRYQNSPGTCTNCAITAFSQNAGDMLKIVANWVSASVTLTSITDSAGDTWTREAPAVLNNGSGNVNLDVWTALAISASGSNTITFHFSGSTTPFFIVNEYAIVTFDRAASNFVATSGNVSITNSVSSTQEVAVGVFNSGNTQGCPSGWTTRGNISSGALVMCERLLASVASITYAYNLNASGEIELGNYSISSTPTFTAGWYVTLENVGPGVDTVTPTISNINGQSSLKIYPNQAFTLMSDGTNYNALQTSVFSPQVAGIYGQPGIIFGNDQTGQTSAIGDTIMFAVDANTLYRFTGTVNCTTSSAAAQATLNLKYTDTANTAQTVSISDTCTSLVTSGVPNMVVALRAKSGTNITYGVTITNTPTFDVSVRLEKM